MGVWRGLWAGPKYYPSDGLRWGVWARQQLSSQKGAFPLVEGPSGGNAPLASHQSVCMHASQKSQDS